MAVTLSHRTVSVAVAWEKLKGSNDAIEGDMSVQLSDANAPNSAASAAVAVIPAADFASKSASSLVSPLPSVVSSQTELIKRTLRSANAHVGAHAHDIAPSLQSFCYPAGSLDSER